MLLRSTVIALLNHGKHGKWCMSCVCCGCVSPIGYSFIQGCLWLCICGLVSIGEILSLCVSTLQSLLVMSVGVTGVAITVCTAVINDYKSYLYELNQWLITSLVVLPVCLPHLSPLIGLWLMTCWYCSLFERLLDCWLVKEGMRWCGEGSERYECN